MFPFALIRPRLAEWRGWLPPLALPLAMFIALIALGGDRGYVYRHGNVHSKTAIRTLAIAENLSPEHNFRLAHRVWRDDDGGVRYNLYSRFPVGGYALVKLATMPFGNDLAAKLWAGAVLALLMFCGAALLAHLAIIRLTGSRWVAFAAAPLAFSSLYALWYADGPFGEGVMDVFGAALVFHGMVVFVQEGRFRQLLVKTFAALLLGWHVYALILPFALLGFGGEAIALLRSEVSANEKARAAIIALARSRYAALAAAAILFGSALLAFNIANEYATYGGDLALSDTPALGSMARRFGVNQWATDWDSFTRRQLYRVGVMVTPYALARAVGWDFPIENWEPHEPPLAPTALGAAATIAALAALAFVRRCRLLTATAVLFGFCWSIPLRYQTYVVTHAYEGLWYMALALALFTLALVGARRLLGARLGGAVAIAAAAIAAPIFAISVFHAGQIGRDAGEAERRKAEMADFSAVMETARGKRVQVVWRPNLWRVHRYWNTPEVDWRSWMRYWLAGSYFRSASSCDFAGESDFTLARYRDDSLNPLTPENRFAFLYEWTSSPELCRAERRRLESSEPSARAAWDVYIQDDAISWLKAPCEPRDYDAPFYAYVHPVNPNDLPDWHIEDGFHPTPTSIDFADLGATFDGACLMSGTLPDYPIAAIQTGQWLPGGERMWEVFATPPLNEEALALYEKIYQDITASGEPAARAGFDLYLNDNTLSYIKEPCAENDARGRFFLSVHPANVLDLPPDRREIGHESLNFTFAPPAGAVFNGKCMATRRLPDYEITKIETGQWIPGGERLWDAEIVVSR